MNGRDMLPTDGLGWGQTLAGFGLVQKRSNGAEVGVGSTCGEVSRLTCCLNGAHWKGGWPGTLRLSMEDHLSSSLRAASEFDFTLKIFMAS